MFSAPTNRRLFALVCAPAMAIVVAFNCPAVTGSEAATKKKRAIDADTTFSAIQKRTKDKELSSVTSLPELATFQGTSSKDATAARNKLFENMNLLLFPEDNRPKITRDQLQDIKQAAEFMADRYNTFDRSDKIPAYLRNLVIRVSRSRITVPDLKEYDYGKNEIMIAAALALAKTGDVEQVETITDYLPKLAPQLIRTAKDHPQRMSPDVRDSGSSNPRMGKLPPPDLKESSASNPRMGKLPPPDAKVSDKNTSGTGSLPAPKTKSVLVEPDGTSASKSDRQKSLMESVNRIFHKSRSNISTD